MGIRAAVAEPAQGDGPERPATKAAPYLQASKEWSPDPRLFTLWTLPRSQSRVEAVLELPEEPEDAVGAMIAEATHPDNDDYLAWDNLTRIEEPVGLPSYEPPLLTGDIWTERRVSEIVAPFMDGDLLVTVAQSLPSRPRREEEQAPPVRNNRQGAAYVGKIEPQPLPTSGGPSGPPRTPTPLGPRPRPQGMPARYLPMMPAPDRGRPWGKTAILGTVLVAGVGLLTWAVLGLPVPNSEHQPSTATKPIASTVATSPSTAGSAQTSTAPKSASTAPSVSAPAQPPAGPTVDTKNGPKTMEQVRTELKASGYPFNSSTDPQDLVNAYQATAKGQPAPLPAVFTANAPAGAQPGAVPANWLNPAPNGAWAGRTTTQILTDFDYAAGGPGHETEAQSNWTKQHTAEIQEHGF